MHSAPPASATSTVERRIARYASPSAWADEVHAVWMVAVGPSIPKRPASRAARYWGLVRYAARELPDEPRRRLPSVRRATCVGDRPELAQIVTLTARPDEHPRPGRRQDLACAGGGHGTAGRSDTDDRPARLPRVQLGLGAELLDQRRVRQRGGDPGRQPLGVEVADPPHSRRARERGLPERVDVEADRRDHAKPGHDDAPATPGVRRGASSHHRPSAPAPG